MLNRFWKDYKRTLKHSELTYKLWIVIGCLAFLSAFLLVGAFVDERPTRQFCALALAIPLGLTAYGLFRWLRAADSESHEVAVTSVPPENNGETSYVAICECGWVGEVMDRELDARADGGRHTPNVRPGVEHPVMQ